MRVLVGAVAVAVVLASSLAQAAAAPVVLIRKQAVDSSPTSVKVRPTPNAGVRLAPARPLPPARKAKTVDLDGSGTLTAEGRGVIKFVGSGSIHVEGSGGLTVQDLGGDANVSVSGEGKKKVTKKGVQHFAGFKGTADISGSNIKVRVAGKITKFEVTGSGKTRLRGRGTYTANGKTAGWKKHPRADVIIAK